MKINKFVDELKRRTPFTSNRVTWTQVYDPTGHWWLSTLIAALPIIVGIIVTFYAYVLPQYIPNGLNFIH